MIFEDALAKHLELVERCRETDWGTVGVPQQKLNGRAVRW